MCTFRKEIDGKIISCYYAEDAAFDARNIVDDQGLCIFHSELYAWKRENNFTHYLEELIKYFEKEPSRKTIFLADVVFTDDIGCVFSNKKFTKDVNLKRARFKDGLVIKNSIFKKLNFKSSIFDTSLSFSGLSINEITFDDACLKSKFSIDNCDFYLNFYMLNVQCHGGILVKKSMFHSKAFFQGIITNSNLSIRQGITFDYIHFKDFTSFESTEFNATVDFNNITVHKELIFHNTQFNYNEPLPISSSVNIKNLVIKEKGRVDFRGTPENKMFNKVQDVSLFEEKIEGEIFFENTDFTKFSAVLRERLFSASKLENPKVMLGVGCKKYYNRTPLKSIDIDDDHQNLVVELCNTFVDYFTKNRGFNLGVEFVSKTERKINFFYFSDEVLPYHKFEAQLQKGEHDMWQLIKIEKNNLSTRSPEANVASSVIYATDTVINLCALVLKICSRIPLGLINKEEILSLLNTTIPSQSKHNNGLIVNQIILFGMKNIQNFEVKKIG